MKLPGHIAFCVQRLETAGFAAYAVGGCVRDRCLGLVPHDYDLCTAARPEEMEQLFSEFPLVLAGRKHGTVGVVLEGQVVEITTFRTEGDYSDNRHPDSVAFVDRIEEDLARRDFTVNAMAWSPTRGFADPFGGRADLQAGILRAVGEPEVRFREDSLRILRGVRFAARYGLEPEKATADAMARLAPLMDNLARERVFDELCKLLPLVTAADLLRFAPVITQVIPELQSAVGFDQRSPHHVWDVYTHTAHVVEGAAPDLVLRWAALLHDVGKVPCFTLDEDGRGHFLGHAQVGAELAARILRRLKAPTALREQVVLLIGQHMTRLTDDRRQLSRLVRRFGFDTTEAMLRLQTADFAGKGKDSRAEVETLRRAAELLGALRREAACFSLKDLAVNGHDLMALGFRGKAIGEALNRLLDGVVEETFPNEKERLLAEAASYL